ncbi:MAG: hypothetical protein VW258_01930 [Thalassolituus sp.]
MEELEQRIGLKGIPDSGLSTVNAFGIEEDSQYLIDLANNNGPDEISGQSFIMMTLQAVLPGLNFVGDYQISGVEYLDPEGPRSIINGDGTISLVLPSRISEISYIGMKLNPEDSAIIGNLLFKNIEIETGSTVTLLPRPEGQ